MVFIDIVNRSLLLFNVYTCIIVVLIILYQLLFRVVQSCLILCFRLTPICEANASRLRIEHYLEIEDRAGGGVGL